MGGIVFGESPRWREGRLWFSDWGSGRVYSITADGTPAVEVEVASFPMCIDFLPDGRLLVVSSAARQILKRVAISDDDSTLVVAESYAEQLTAFKIADDGGLTDRRVWAETPGDHPDGICLDEDRAVWYADVANRHCLRVREGGSVMATLGLDRGAFACALSRGRDPKLFVVAQEWSGADAVGGATGQVVVFPAPAAGAGHP